MDIEKLKAAVTEQVDVNRQRLSELARKIHDNPEPGFQEVKAAAWLTQFLEENSFSVKRGICRLPTAFRASYGKGRPVIALIAEYDALPGVGHACGHNISGNISTGAAVAAKLAIDQFPGCVTVIGTPAEELYAGKAIMVKRGAFSDVDVAMMVHSGTGNTATTSALACQNLYIEFFGQAAHAAARPEKGINALEAMIQSFTAINSLRQHIKSSARIHGIITDGGQVSNVVPDHSAGEFIVRAEEDDYLEELKKKVVNCFKGAAGATGARLKYKWDAVRYAPMRNNLTLARLFVDNMKSLGRSVDLPDSGGFGSTDMGNVSQIVPTIHANVAVAPRGTLLHSPEFANAVTSEAAIDGLCDAAKTLSMVVVDLLASPETLAEVKGEFKGGQ
ncbi:MAG: M20 family metallopeptidase [Dehalococcoidales bacterium]|nr:MAG: M20 family metallopeptidase [Dehalococcoidales bacterium]